MENLEGGEFRMKCAANAIGMGLGIATGNLFMIGYSAYSFFSSGCHND
ncbi:MAG: hypothetical protein ACOVMG_06165 [Flavobacterium sp.]